MRSSRARRHDIGLACATTTPNVQGSSAHTRAPGTLEDVEERLAQAALEHKPVLSFEQLAEGLRHAGPPTADDVTITSDGRRIDSRERVLAWVEEMNALPRAAGHGAHPAAVKARPVGNRSTPTKLCRPRTHVRPHGAAARDR